MQPTKRTISDPAEIDHNEFRRLYEQQGLGTEAVAKKLGCNRECAAKVRDQLGIKPHKSGRWLTDEERATVKVAHARYLEGGISFVKAAKLFGISANRLQAWHVRQHERQRTGETAVEKAAREADLATRRETRRLIALFDRRRELLGGVPWDACQ